MKQDGQEKKRSTAENEAARPGLTIRAFKLLLDFFSKLQIEKFENGCQSDLKL